MAHSTLKAMHWHWAKTTADQTKVDSTMAEVMVVLIEMESS